MANQCCYCNVRHIDTNMLVLGDNWIEFCEECGPLNTVTNRDTGETMTISAVFDRLNLEAETREFDPAI